MKRVGMLIFVLILGSVLVSAQYKSNDNLYYTDEEQIPVTIYDPLFKRNVPIWSLTVERLDLLLELNSPLAPSREVLERIREHIGWDKSYTTKTKNLNVNRKKYTRTIPVREEEKRGKKSQKGLSAAKPTTFSTKDTYNTAKLPITIYDPISKRNKPLWAITQERLEEIISYDSPLGLTQEQLEALKEKIGWDNSQKDYKKSRTKESPVKRTKRAKELTKDEIAEEFGIKTIFDPVFKINRPIGFISRQRLVAFLNNPVTKKMSFTGKEEWVQAKLEELDLIDDAYTSRDSRAYKNRGGITGSYHISKPASTLGLKTKTETNAAKVSGLNSKKSYYVNNPIINSYDQTIK